MSHTHTHKVGAMV